MAIVGIALFLRLLMTFDTGGFGDEEVRIAHEVASGNGFQAPSLYGDEIRSTSQKSPAVSYLIALSLLLSSSFPYVGFIVVQAIVGAVGCWWLARLGEMTLGYRTGLIAAMLAAFFVPHIWWIRHYGEHIFAATGMIGVLLLLYRAENTRRLREAIGFGVAVGLTGYFTADVLLAAPFLALWLAWRDRERGLWSSVKRPLIAGFVAFVVLAPWTVRNYNIHGTFVLVRTGFGTALWWGNNPEATGTDWFLVEDADGTVQRVSGRYSMPPDLYDHLSTLSEVEQERHLTRVAVDWIRDHPGEAIALWFRKLYYFWWFSNLNDLDPVPVARDLAWGSVLLLFVVGMIQAGRKPTMIMARSDRVDLLPARVCTQFSDLAPLFFPLATSTWVHVTTVVSANWRMRIPIEPIVLLFSAYAMLTLFTAVSRRRPDTTRFP